MNTTQRTTVVLEDIGDDRVLVHVMGYGSKACFAINVLDCARAIVDGAARGVPAIIAVHGDWS